MDIRDRTNISLPKEMLNESIRSCDLILEVRKYIRSDFLIREEFFFDVDVYSVDGESLNLELHGLGEVLHTNIFHNLGLLHECDADTGEPRAVEDTLYSWTLQGVGYYSVIELLRCSMTEYECLFNTIYLSDEFCTSKQVGEVGCSKEQKEKLKIHIKLFCDILRPRWREQAKWANYVLKRLAKVSKISPASRRLNNLLDWIKGSANMIINQG